MRSKIIVFLIIFAFALPTLTAMATNDFYLYQDLDRDGKLDNRIHFRGDIEQKLKDYMEFGRQDLCEELVIFGITNVICHNEPPCPGALECGPRSRYPVVETIMFDTLACTCVAKGAGKELGGVVYIRTGDEKGSYRLVAMSAKDFLTFLMQNFEVIGDDKHIGCDSLVTIQYTVFCDSNWECPPTTNCEVNPNAELIGFVASYPLCECKEPGDVPTMTQWGVIILVALLISSAVFIGLRRRKAAVPA
jgi:hypothetical protein